MRCFPLTLSTSFNYIHFHVCIGVGVGKQYIGLLQDILSASESSLPTLSDPFFSPHPLLNPRVSLLARTVLELTLLARMVSQSTCLCLLPFIFEKGSH